MPCHWRFATVAVFVSLAGTLSADEPAASPERGYELLRTKAYLPTDFDRETYENLWKAWPEPLRSRAAKATEAERREMAFSRYGMMEPPESPGEGPALGYVDDGKGGWVANCFLCHGGKVAGRVVPGLPNSHVALRTLADDVRWVKLVQGKLSPAKLAASVFPVGGTNGTTNSVAFGVAFGAVRNADMTVRRGIKIPNFEHHDLDAPAWWNVKKKDTLYFDGFSPKTHRVLMQFLLHPVNGRERVLEWEDDFRHVLAYIESLEAPPYPFEIDESLAERGRVVFENTCSRCHGTYGENETYEQRVVPIEEVGTDPVRLRALTREHKSWLVDSWMSHYGEDPVDLDAEGYVAPPLDGIWATAPYFHNGSVPTLRHVLHPDRRPVVWRRTEDGYDRERVGLEIDEFDELPDDVPTDADRRWYFDTRRPGKSAAGHDFPDVLNAGEKRALLEYLKTL